MDKNSKNVIKEFVKFGILLLLSIFIPGGVLIFVIVLFFVKFNKFKKMNSNYNLEDISRLGLKIIKEELIVINSIPAQTEYERGADGRHLYRIIFTVVDSGERRSNLVTFEELKKISVNAKYMSYCYEDGERKFDFDNEIGFNCIYTEHNNSIIDNNEDRKEIPLESSEINSFSEAFDYLKSSDSLNEKDKKDESPKFEYPDMSNIWDNIGI